jgi:hypothetical protein
MSQQESKLGMTLYRLIEELAGYSNKRLILLGLVCTILLIPCYEWVLIRIGPQFSAVDFVTFMTLYMFSLGVVMALTLILAAIVDTRIWRKKEYVLLSKDTFEWMREHVTSKAELDQWLDKVHYGELDVKRVREGQLWAIAFVPPARRGRPKGRLSSLELDGDATIDDILPFLKQAQRARERKDGSFAQLCREKNYPESTVRTWLDVYADKIPRD